MSFKLAYISSRPLGLLMLVIVLAQTNNLCYCGGQNGELGHSMPADGKHKPAGDSEPIELADYDGYNSWEVESLSGNGNKNGNAELRTASIILQCPTKASPKRDGIKGFASMTLHRPAEKGDYKIEEDSKGEWLENDVDTMVKDGGFNLTRPTVVYMNGWRPNMSKWWMKAVKNLYDSNEEEDNFNPGFNLLFFDWAAYDFFIYGKSVGHVPNLGQLLAQFFEQLRDRHQYDTSSLHFVSFSLSAHIAGVAGRQLAKKEQIEQITALDPTGMCFHEESSRRFFKKYGLKSTDAKLVVARHYNMRFHGSRQTIGGLDIIVNNGNWQPIMIGPRKQTQSLRSLWTPWDVVSHMRALKHETQPFFMESDCHEMAYSCPSYRAYLAGECGDCGKNDELCYLFSTFGNIQLKTPTSRYKPGTKMYIKTGFKKYCKYNYQVVVHLKSNVSSSTREKFSRGHFKFWLVPLSAKAKPKHMLDSDKFTQLLKLKRKIVLFKKNIKLKLKSAKLLDSLDYVEVKYLSHVSSEVRKASSAKYCPNNQTGKHLVKCTDDADNKSPEDKPSEKKSPEDRPPRKNTTKKPPKKNTTRMPPKKITTKKPPIKKDEPKEEEEIEEA